MSKPYRPSNGTEGEGFMTSFCFECVKDRACNRPNPDWANGCQILADAYAYNVKDPNYPKEWIYGKDGPCCTAFVEDVGQPWPDPRALSEAEQSAQLPLA